MSAVYNEHDPHAAAWLRNLIEEGSIAHGDVDERSIRDVEASDYRGYAQVHLFAGVGIWSAAARVAGWPDDRRLGTISCPCQPFSAAGKGLGFADPRHLWPDAFRIARELRLDVLFGEQAPTAGHWIDLVAADLEGVGYAFGAPVIPAAGFGGAHIRQRFYWVADTDNTEWWADRAPRHDGDWPQTGRVQGASDARERSAVVRLENSSSVGLQGRALSGQFVYPGVRRLLSGGPSEPCDWVQLTDGRWRPIEPGTSPLATPNSSTSGRLRAYGNALDLETAANFIGAYLDCAPQRAAA